ncbi:MAG: tRNA (guanosine(46)-N7)-methyltransferase TrmB [Pseudomonadaceae bacterium]|nr:tRNA (guanosine(46)-N7)-methyltransferase TrmB [Pseudomonadaceae bacterium]
MTDDQGSFGDKRLQVYVRRKGRITKGQQRALDEYSTRYVVAPEALQTPQTLFGRDAPLGIEIGFGMGHALTAWAAAEPDWNLVGIDVYQPGIGAALLGIVEGKHDNVVLMEADARAVVASLPSASIDALHVFFPDPWPKARHHKRRIIEPEFTAVMADRLRPGGKLRVATDIEAYAQVMLEVLEAEPGLANDAGSGFAPRPNLRPITHFESRGLARGHGVWDFAYTRKG